jgi:SAM-dependent methyltransferase
MTDWQAKNVDVYNQTATEMAEKFRRIGPRVRDIERAFSLAPANGNDNLVVEIGCGDGRDAKEIVTRTKQYIGIDPSVKLLELAKAFVPDGEFVLADALNYQYPNNICIIFSFASLLHVNQDDLAKIFSKTHAALAPKGIFYISLKWAPSYQEVVKKDEFGERLFYFYTPELIQELAGQHYTTVYNDRQLRTGANHAEWFTIALRKV